jgi:hypothetical protein
VEQWSRAPMVSLELSRSRNCSDANLLTLFLYASFRLMFFFPMDPLTTTVMNAVPESSQDLPQESIVPSPVWPLCLRWLFSVRFWSRCSTSRLIETLNRIALIPNVRAQVDAARPQLAAARNPNPIVQRAITESFLTWLLCRDLDGDGPCSVECYQRVAAH